MGRPLLIRTHKKCSVCGEEKLISTDFYITKQKGRSRPSVSSMCKICHTNKHKEKYHEETKEKRQRRQENNSKNHLLRKYGLTTEEFSGMILEQNNKCKICECELEDPQVDHNHATGKVRALLCRPCNLSLGLLKENPHILRNMVNYINDYLPKD
jgi:hypothetical protein